MKKSNTGNVSSIETSGFVDGPGVRVVVFMQGCPFRCLYCHNPETWDGGQIKNLYTPKQVIEKIKKYKTYFGKSGGVTFSGGDPLLQQEFVTSCLKLCKQNGINTALDTAGGVEVYTDILDYTDLVILDVKSTLEEEFRFITSNSKQKFDVFLRLCQDKKKPLWLRQVIVPNLNDTPQSVQKLVDFAKKLKYVKRVELLGYHDMAKEKYKQLGIKYRLENVSNMDKEKLKQLQDIIDNEGIWQR